jgi:hypothetical protein
MTVTQLRPSKALTPEQTSHRILAAVRAVHAFHELLVITDNRKRSSEKEELSDATKAYREIIRDAEDRGDSITPDEAHSILPTICDGLRTRDAIKDANDAARRNRKAERERVADALKELQSPAKDDGAQGTLPGLEDATGLGWFSADTKAVTYTALLDADEREAIDSVQADLLGDLGGLGLDAIEFVIDAADAVDEDEDPEVDEDAVAELDEIVGDDLPV